MLTEFRTAVAEALTAAGIDAADYVGEQLEPPCAVVVPSEPYISTEPRPDRPFVGVAVSVDVLLIGLPLDADTTADAMDSMIETALAATREYDVLEVSQPNEVTLSGQTFLGAVMSITEPLPDPRRNA